MQQTAFEDQVRSFVYRHFVNQCRAPTIAETADALATQLDHVRDTLTSLAQGHVLVLQPESREIWMAMPFSALPTPFRVTSGDSGWWANCAWDALGVPALLGQDATIDTRCPVSDAPLQIEVTSGQLAPGSAGLVHFTVPAARWWEDIGYT